jgi:hypothetical protein
MGDNVDGKAKEITFTSKHSLDRERLLCKAVHSGCQRRFSA